MLLVDIGVPYMDIIDAFENRLMSGGHIITQTSDKSRFLSSMRAIIELLQHWIQSARSDSSFAKKQLFSSMGNGTLMSKIDVIKSQLISMPEANNILEIIRVIDDDIRNFR